MKQGPDDAFRRRVLAANAAHVPRTALTRQAVARCGVSSGVCRVTGAAHGGNLTATCRAGKNEGGRTQRTQRKGFPAGSSFPSRAPGKWLALSSMRSEEHTSQLQSLRHLVCRLLLEKKQHMPIVVIGEDGQKEWLANAEPIVNIIKVDGHELEVVVLIFQPAASSPSQDYSPNPAPSG